MERTIAQIIESNERWFDKGIDFLLEETPADRMAREEANRWFDQVATLTVLGIEDSGIAAIIIGDLMWVKTALELLGLVA